MSGRMRTVRLLGVAIMTTDDQGKLQLTGHAPQTPGTWLVCASDQSNQYWTSTVLTAT